MSKLVLRAVLTASAVLMAGLASAQDAPAALTASATAPGQVTLSWTGSSGVTYHVFRDYSPVVITVGPISVVNPGALVASVTSGTTYVDSGLEPLVQVYYAVTAVTDAGDSGPSPQAVVMTTAPANATIFGFADVHNHMFANLGFGGRMMWGEPFDPAGMTAALPSCTALDTGLPHGPWGLGDPVGNFLSTGNPISGHDGAGAPDFTGWPSWNTYTHQQMYIDWLRRAFLAGEKLMVMHAVNNQLLCQVETGPFSCDDMGAVDRQLKAANDLDAAIDWIQIAHSSTEARQIINSGRMAVVLGIEVDDLFNCSSGTCTQDDLKARLRTYYDLGVRHLFPVHVFDNAFGGAAMYNDLFDIGNNLVTGSFFGTRECATDLSVPAGQHGYQVTPVTGIDGFILSVLGIGQPSATGNVADCNSRGLTPLGESLVRLMMGKKMILDIDHLSTLAADDALGIAEGVGYPVVAGHTGLVGTSSGNKRSEGQKSDAQLTRIHNLHGLVAPILHQGTKDEIVGYGPVANDCSNSSKSWAQAYLYTVDHTGGDAVGLGTDFNGLAGQPGPRFGSQACPGDDPLVAQGGGVSYPFAPFGKPGSIDRSIVGSRAYDFNNDGLAHVGMIPDFIQDLRSVGLTDQQLQPLFGSAEAYIRMWARAEAANAFAPTLSFSLKPLLNKSGWANTDVVLGFTGTANPAGWDVTAIDYSATGAQTIAPTKFDGATGDVTVTAEGITKFAATAVDEAGNTSTPLQPIVRVDRTAPIVTCGTADGLWHGSDVSIACSASDAVSGLAVPADASFSLTTAIDAGVETSSATTDSRVVADNADNTTTAGPVAGNKVDKKAPSIAITAPTADVYVLNRPVMAAYACTDGGSGVATCAGPVASGAQFSTSAAGTQTFTVDATDQVGNASNASVAYTVSYAVCALYDASRPKKSGSTISIKLQLCDYNGADVSSSAVVVAATGIGLQSTGITGIPDDAGDANPDLNFRFDPTLGPTGGYIYNLSTNGLGTGTYELAFTATGDPITHVVTFQVK